jgi:hypothetical protein
MTLRVETAVKRQQVAISAKNGHVTHIAGARRSVETHSMVDSVSDSLGLVLSVQSRRIFQTLYSCSVERLVVVGPLAIAIAVVFVASLRLLVQFTSHRSLLRALDTLIMPYAKIII